MIVLSLDLASTLSGWALFDNKLEGASALLEKGIIEPRPKSLSAEQRLPIIEREFLKVLDSHSPKTVLLENPAGGKEDVKISQYNTGPTRNWMTMSVLFMTHGVIRNILEKKGIPYHTISPSTWQNRVGIFKRDRDGRKDGAKKYVLENYPQVSDKEMQDIYDAICIYDAWVFNEKWEKERVFGERSAF